MGQERSTTTKMGKTLEHTPAARRAGPTGQPPRLPASRSKPAAVTYPAAAPATSPGDAAPQRRKRQVARTMRRFEAAVARLPKPTLRRNNSQTSKVTPTVWPVRTMLALAFLLALAVAIGYLHNDERWFVYRETVQINGLTYLNAEEVYAASGVDSWHALWLRAPVIRDRLRTLPFVEDAHVSISFPNEVALDIIETEPVALWVTTDQTHWLMPDGSALPVADDRFDHLPPLIDPQGDARRVGSAGRLALNPSVLGAARALWERVPEIGQLRFNHDYGLNFQLPGTLTWVYWGDGANLDGKFAHLEAIQKLIAAGETRPQVIDLRYERPYVH
jgi:cell division protein FtsQ